MDRHGTKQKDWTDGNDPEFNSAECPGSRFINESIEHSAWRRAFKHKNRTLLLTGMFRNCKNFQWPCHEGAVSWSSLKIVEAVYKYGYSQKEVDDHLGKHYTTISIIICKTL
ncbi:MAG: hypothetical protein VST72_06525, partial [Nitrospirota bacterium]|nr:hypothetical protein [Nitrospirota bacterium]